MKNQRLAVILPVHNEEKTIKGVIDAILSFNLFDEIIAVTDGTTDRSLEILGDYAKRKKIIWLNYKRNRGKGFALAKGVAKSTADIVIFFDTDGEDVKKEHLTKMIDPLVAGEVDCVIGFITCGRFNKEAALFRRVCGNRGYFRKDVLPYLKELETKRRGVELFLNYELSKKGKKIILVPLTGLHHRLKHHKRTPQEAALDYLREGYELAVEYARQRGLTGRPRTEFIKSQMIKFLKDYARYFKLPAEKTKAAVSDFIRRYRR